MIWNICIIPGTRPETIKMSLVVRACEGSGVEWFMVHTGQDRSRDVGRVCSGGIGLPDVRYNPDVGSGVGGQGAQTGRMLAGIGGGMISEYGAEAREFVEWYGRDDVVDEFESRLDIGMSR